MVEIQAVQTLLLKAGCFILERQVSVHSVVSQK